MKILVVDDDESSLRTMRSLLKAEGHEVFTARNGLLGYFGFLACRAELVWTDIEMPFQDGFAMISRIRNINPRVRTIYMSGEVQRYHSQLDAERKNHAATVLEKPFSCRNLSEIISIDPKSWLLPPSQIEVGAFRQSFGPVV
jgi:DNA-binding NtrC family response regulator